MIYLLDTSAYSQAVLGNADMAILLKEAGEILVPNVTIAELRHGFMLGDRQLDNEKLLARFLANKKVRVLLPDNLTTDYYVELSTYLKRQGRKLSHNDLWIAALASQREAILVSFDNDFSYLPSGRPKIHLLRPVV